MKNYAVFKLSLHVLLFRGRVRRGQGEEAE
jgi:hypothetical protein